MKKIFTILFAAALTGCIEPLVLTPDIEGEITAFEVEEQRGTASINASTRTVNIRIAGDIDPKAVKITRIGLIETATCDIAAGDVVDLSSPLRVKVKTAAEYEWTISATRGEISALPGGGFDEWSSTGSRPTWNPWPRGPEIAAAPEEGEWEVTRWWDTGNKGVNTLTVSNTTPTEPGEGCPANPSGRAARLESINAVLKAAGGNIYFGEFGGLSGLDAKCNMGHLWSKKPHRLKGWFKYFPQLIDKAHGSYRDLRPYGFREDSHWLGKPDSLSVTVALWASPDGADKPFVVNTAPRGPFVDLTRDKEGIIAWGQFTSGVEQAEWKDFSLDVEYLKPEYLNESTPLPANTRLIVTVSASKYANYFIAGTSGGGTDGKTGSLMYVDELELVY